MGDNSSGDFNAFENSLVSAIQQPNIASELIGQNDDIRKLFLTLSRFMDVNEANDFASCLHKCDKYGLKEQRRLFEYMINGRVSVKGWRSAQIVDVLTQIQRMDTKGMEKADARQQMPRGVKTSNY